MSLDPRDAIDREPVLALKVHHEMEKFAVKHVAHGLPGGHAPQALQALAQPGLL